MASILEVTLSILLRSSCKAERFWEVYLLMSYGSFQFPIVAPEEHRSVELSFLFLQLPPLVKGTSSKKVIFQKVIYWDFWL